MRQVEVVRKPRNSKDAQTYYPKLTVASDRITIKYALDGEYDENHYQDMCLRIADEIPEASPTLRGHFRGNSIKMLNNRKEVVMRFKDGQRVYTGEGA